MFQTFYLQSPLCSKSFVLQSRLYSKHLICNPFCVRNPVFCNPFCVVTKNDFQSQILRSPTKNRDPLFEITVCNTRPTAGKKKKKKKKITIIQHSYQEKKTMLPTVHQRTHKLTTVSNILLQNWAPIDNDGYTVLLSFSFSCRGTCTYLLAWKLNAHVLHSWPDWWNDTHLFHCRDG